MKRQYVKSLTEFLNESEHLDVTGGKQYGTFVYWVEGEEPECYYSDTASEAIALAKRLVEQYKTEDEKPEFIEVWKKSPSGDWGASGSPLFKYDFMDEYTEESSEPQTSCECLVFDNGGETYDRYTIINTETGDVCGASENPFTPNGFGQFSGNCVTDWKKSIEEVVADYRERFTEVPYESLNPELKRYVDYCSEC